MFAPPQSGVVTQASVCRRVSFENPNAAKVLVCTRFHDADVTANTAAHWAEVVVRSLNITRSLRQPQRCSCTQLWRNVLSPSIRCKFTAHLAERGCAGAWAAYATPPCCAARSCARLALVAPWLGAVVPAQQHSDAPPLCVQKQLSLSAAQKEEIVNLSRTYRQEMAALKHQRHEHMASLACSQPDLYSCAGQCRNSLESGKICASLQEMLRQEHQVHSEYAIAVLDQVRTGRLRASRREWNCLVSRSRCARQARGCRCSAGCSWRRRA